MPGTFLFPIVNTEQRVFVAFAVVFAIVPVCMVCLRVLARRVANRRLGLSDWLMVVSSALLVVYQGVNISAVVVGGLGLHVSEIINKYGVATGQETFMKHLLAMQCLWCIDLVLAKLATLTLYTKIFETRTFIVLAKATGVLIILWAITMIVGSVLICQPIAFYWDHTIEGGFCGDYYALWLTTGVLNIVTDLVVLLLPMPHLYSLSMARYKKVMLMGTFGMGLITCVISAVRLWSLSRFQQADATHSTVQIALLSQLEPSLLITLGCLPLLRPLLGRRYSSQGTARYIHTGRSSSGGFLTPHGSGGSGRFSSSSRKKTTTPPKIASLHKSLGGGGGGGGGGSSGQRKSVLANNTNKLRKKVTADESLLAETQMQMDEQLTTDGSSRRPSESDETIPTRGGSTHRGLHRHHSSACPVRVEDLHLPPHLHPDNESRVAYGDERDGDADLEAGVSSVREEGASTSGGGDAGGIELRAIAITKTWRVGEEALAEV